jgi:tetratricopeptide (TPR) repeat protein
MNRIRTALMMLAVVTTPTLLAQEREVFSGAALLYTVPEITIVYPAGPTENRERNRISAERRAAYMKGRHKTVTRVVADVDITEDERKAHLLVLGWNNLLIEQAGQAERSAEGWSFQGIQRGYDRDLLFGWVSPFSDLHEFFFWSRIDPELDRYQVLPFYGSDWIVFDAYTIEQFGRFNKDDLTWPPERKTSVEADNRTSRPLPTAKGESKHYVLYDMTQMLKPAEAEAILQARESAWSAATVALDAAPPQPTKIKVYVYKDSETKQVLCDVSDARHHLAARGELHLTRAIATDPNLHEDMHLIARQLYGPGFISLLVEGLAVWAEQQQGPDEFPVYAAMLTEVQLPSLAQLLDEETMRVLNRGRTGFSLAGLFVAWLRAEVGPEAIGKLYGHYSSDPELFAAALGLSVEQIETRFNAFAYRLAEGGKNEALFREATAKARHYGGIGDYEQAIPALERALELRPANLFTRYSLGVVQMEMGDLDTAEAGLTRVIQLHGEAPSVEVALLAWYKLGALYLKRSQLDKARQAYEQVLELPDYRGMHARARDALEELDEP